MRINASTWAPLGAILVQLGAISPQLGAISAQLGSASARLGVAFPQLSVVLPYAGLPRSVGSSWYWAGNQGMGKPHD